MNAWWSEYAAAGCYAVALAGYWLELTVPVSDRWRRGIRLLLGMGFTVQAVEFLWHWWWSGRLPLVGYRDSLRFLNLAVAATVIFMERQWGLTVLGGFVLPVAVLCAVARTPQTAPAAPFMAAFGVGMAYLLQERQLKSKRIGRVVHQLPSLEELDRLGFQLIAVAVPLLAVGFGAGWMWSREWSGVWMVGNPKEMWVAATLLLYGVYLGVRLVLGWRGRSAVYLSLVGFGLMLVTYIGVNVLGWHHYKL